MFLIVVFEIHADYGTERRPTRAHYTHERWRATVSCKVAKFTQSMDRLQPADAFIRTTHARLPYDKILKTIERFIEAVMVELQERP